MQMTFLAGRIVKPAIAKTKKGHTVLSFSIPDVKTYQDRDGQPAKKTTWFRVKVFGGYADALSRIVKDGGFASVYGDISANTYVDKDGKAQGGLEIVATNVLVGFQNAAIPEGFTEAPEDMINKYKAAVEKDTKETAEDIDTDDLPF